MRAGGKKARGLKIPEFSSGDYLICNITPGLGENSPQNFILLTHYYFGQTANFHFSFLVTKAQGSFRMIFNVF